MLDPFPYSGGLTTCEALWMGVPTVTLPGEIFASRHSMSHLSNAGLADWVAPDLAAYVELAAREASDIPALAALRSGLRARVKAESAVRRAALRPQPRRCAAHRLAGLVQPVPPSVDRPAVVEQWRRHRRSPPAAAGTPASPLGALPGDRLESSRTAGAVPDRSDDRLGTGAPAFRQTSHSWTEEYLNICREYGAPGET